jgi:hypothetical protein
MSENGLVQCLHEIGADEPTHYVERPAAETKPTEPATEEYQGDGQPAAQPAPKPAAVPPANRPAEIDRSENPFGTPALPTPPQDESNPFGTGDENPFN